MLNQYVHKYQDPTLPPHIPSDLEREYFEAVKNKDRVRQAKLRVMLEQEKTPKVTEKICRVCGMSRPVGAFYKSKKHADGRQSECIICMKARLRKYK